MSARFKGSCAVDVSNSFQKGFLASLEMRPHCGLAGFLAAAGTI